MKIEHGNLKSGRYFHSGTVAKSRTSSAGEYDTIITAGGILFKAHSKGLEYMDSIEIASIKRDKLEEGFLWFTSETKLVQTRAEA
jgi:hypothetical protein